MKCNNGTDLVCTCYEKCNKAWDCSNVPIGIRNKLLGIDKNPKFIRTEKNAELTFCSPKAAR